MKKRIIKKTEKRRVENIVAEFDKKKKQEQQEIMNDNSLSEEDKSMAIRITEMTLEELLYFA